MPQHALVEAAPIKSGLVSGVFVYGVVTPQNVAGEKTLVAAVVLRTPDFTRAALGEEQLEDVTIICRSCHDKEHGRDAEGKQ
ncbi:hypothetical protein GGD63_003889 [Bradyrhizobium sp. cir1]|uniref:hypothetical protein n=1 Tax=Bradyrhizobium sp. cir1 TaxID=1445730 RepID=UPI001605CF9D|nr:hypothetical protein [Bradyrhizobium sp. cir1]MBB4371092.1 hypothetical protein [Bradyrhizobium sp. cir1]